MRIGKGPQPCGSGLPGFKSRVARSILSPPPVASRMVPTRRPVAAAAQIGGAMAVDRTSAGGTAARPAGEPSLRAIAMPADTNPNGDIFGGWLLAQMDLAGGNLAGQRARGRVATVAATAMTFHLPVFVGDEVSCYCALEKIGRSSMTVRIETWVRRRDGGEVVKVTEGIFTYVAIGAARRPRPVDPG